MDQSTLLVLAAGMGSRYGGLKQLDPIGPGGHTILDYSVFDARRAGFERVVFVIRESMRDDFERQVCARFAGRISVGFAFQHLGDLPGGRSVPEGRGKPWGTAHAVLAARDVIGGPMAVVNADDFYGFDAFEQAARFLEGPATTPEGAISLAMVGFELRRTLSEHGTVARGICRTDASGHLESIAELTRIAPWGKGARHDRGDGTFEELTGDEVASMNFWALRPEVFGLFASEFERFLDERGSDPAAEFYIPTAVDALIRSGRIEVDVLSTDADWFGVTYREDRERVASALRALVQAGRYPEHLWD